jgi:cytidyltransferase-like protein
MNIVVFTGGFDPVHSGHISCIKAAKEYGRVVIGLNSDSWLTRKKGKPFMTFDERYSVMNELKDVMTVIDFDDSDDTACDAIQKVLDLFPNNNIVFVNGGDRKETNTPEMEKYKNNTRVSFVFGVGGDNKKNSSSWLLNDWKHPTEKRQWGLSMAYHISENAKVKRLILEPGKSISMQYHNHRSEFWFVESGEGIMRTDLTEVPVKKHTYVSVPRKAWHQLVNTTTEPLCIIEIQYGDICSEDDIIRS